MSPAARVGRSTTVSRLLGVALALAAIGLSSLLSSDGEDAPPVEEMAAASVGGGASSQPAADLGDERRVTASRQEAATQAYGFASALNPGRAGPRPIDGALAKAVPGAGEDGDPPSLSPPDPSPAADADSLPAGIPELSADDPFSIAGRVLDDNGQPLAAVPITARARQLFHLDDDAARAEGSLSTISGPDGGFVFVALEEGVYRVRAEGVEDFFQSAIALVRTGVHSVDLVLRSIDERFVHGVVRSTRGQTLEGVSVYQSNRPAQSTLTDEDGYYRLWVQLAGGERRFSIGFRREGYHELHERGNRAAWTAGAEPERLDVRLEPIGSLATVFGSLVDSDGSPVIGERIELVSLERKRAYHALSNRAGRFVLREVEPAPDYRLMVYPNGPYQDYSRKGVRIAGGERLEVVLRPRERGTVAGVMVDPAGKPIPYFSLYVRSRSAARHVVRVTADETGRFGAVDVPAGTLSFESRADPRLTVQGVRLAPESEKEVELVLDWGERRLFGQVLDPAGSPVPTSRVHLSMTHIRDGVRSHSTRTAVADMNGQFVFTRLGSGMHRLSVSAPGFATASLEHEVIGPSENVTVFLD